MLHDRFELVEVAWLSSFKEFVEQFRVPFMSKRSAKLKKTFDLLHFSVFLRDNYLPMQLILDVGSTKMEWIVLDENAVKQRFSTEGFNPNYTERQYLEVTVESVFKQRLVSQESIHFVHYYGTGCGSEQNCLLIKEVFQKWFPNADVHVTHDLMAACHALLGHEKGIACILGTGSNSCCFDGETIREKAVSLGYLVGDEGSGMHIGREVVKAYFYGFMPEDLKRKFDAEYHLERTDFINRLYHEKQPSRYLASFAKFAGQNQNDPYIRDLLKGIFNTFIKVFILRFEQCKLLKISFVGSVAFHFQELLKESLAEHGLMLSEVMRTPSEGLIRYYGDSKYKNAT